VSTIYGATNQYQVILEVAPEYQANPESLSRLYVRSSSGKLIPLDTVARFSRKTQALTVNHQGQLPSVTFRSTCCRAYRSVKRWTGSRGWNSNCASRSR
jgi:multidrug efflux pump subunit AcrB